MIARLSLSSIANAFSKSRSFLCGNQGNVNNFLALAHSTSPYITVYPWFTNTGFGTKYTDPTTLPFSSGQAIAFNPATNGAVAVSNAGSQGFAIYPWTPYVGGFGTKYSSTPTQRSTDVAFAPNGGAVAISQQSSPYIIAYPWSDSTGVGTAYTTPGGTLSAANAIAFNPAGTAIALGTQSSPRIHAYAWSGSGFGSKYSNPATLPTGSVIDIAYNSTGTAIALAHSTTPFITVYPWNDSTGFGTKYSNPATLPAGNGTSVAFNSANTYLIHTNNTASPPAYIYPWNDSTGFGTAVAIPTGSGTLFNTARSSAAAFSPNGNDVIVGASTTPFIAAYPWTGSFGTRYADPTTLPGSAVLYAKFGKL